MIKRYFLLFIGFILLVAVAGPPVQAGEKEGDHPHRRWKKEVRVDLRVAGAFYNGLAQVGNFDDPPVLPLVPPVAVFLFHTEAKGKPGDATIVGVNQGPGGGTTTIPIEDDPDCFEGANFKQIPNDKEQNENSLVATFKDLSVLNIAKDEERLADAFNCISAIFPPPGFNFTVTRFDAFVPIKFVGGFGRFENATGKGIIRVQSMPVVQGSNFGSEIGTIKGTIILP